MKDSVKSTIEPTAGLVVSIPPLMVSLDWRDVTEDEFAPNEVEMLDAGEKEEIGAL